MIKRSPPRIVVHSPDPNRNRPPMPGPVIQPHILRRVNRTAEQQVADEIVRTAFSGQNPTTPAQSRNMRGRAIQPAKPHRAKPLPQENQAAPSGRVQRDVAGLAVSSLATIYGCCGIFDLCSDRDLMSFSFQGSDPFLDWIGWERTDVCTIIKNFISYTRPEYDGADPTSGYVSDPCADPNGVDWGTCDFELTDFARLRRWGPTRDITKANMRLCETAPRYRLDGTPITDDREYDMRVTTEVLLQDLRRMLVNGNATTPGQFNGLERLIKTGYTSRDGTNCQAMNSNVINWNNSVLGSPVGATWNGAAIGTGYTFIDVLLNVYRNIRQRIAMSPVLAAQPLQVGDIVLALPTAFIDCLLNHFTCWRVCAGSQYNENNLDSLEARNFRNGLDGGMFGMGQIMLHNFTIPIVAYDYGLIKGPNRFDAYMLVGSVGNVKLIQGQYNDMNYAAGVRPDRFAVTDGGRVLTYSQDDHTCEKRVVEMQPRLLNWAPWAQTRIQNLRCNVAGPVLSSDPTETSFYPLQSFDSAICPA